MSLLRGIQKELSRSDADVVAVPRQCKILAARLKSAEFAKWVDRELNGSRPSRKVKDQASIQVTPDQAAKVQTFLDNASKNAPNYNLYHSNCAQFCERALQAGGAKNVPLDLTPKGLVLDLTPKGLVNDLNDEPSFVDCLRMVPVAPFF